ncbi:MAG: substrate-binding domain-containing protein [Betaproteobacteria bacterium]
MSSPLAMRALSFALAALLVTAGTTRAEGIQYPDDFFQQFPLYRPVDGLSGEVDVLSSPVLDVVFRRAMDEFAKFYPKLDVRLAETAGDRPDIPESLIAGKSSFIGVLTPLTERQSAGFEKRFGYPPTLVKFAVAAIGIFVARDNPIAGLTLKQLDAIFSAERRRGGREAVKWGDLGLGGKWVDQTIVAFGNRGEVGFYEWFRQAVLLGSETKGTMREQLSDTSSIQGVGIEPGGIAYANLLFATPRTRFLPIFDDDGKLYSPLHSRCVNQQYPLCGFIYIYANAGENGKLSLAAREFIKYLLSREGQTAVADGAQYPVSPEISRKEIESLNRGTIAKERTAPK